MTVMMTIRTKMRVKTITAMMQMTKIIPLNTNDNDNNNSNIQLSPEGEVNSGGYIPRREASRYISTALHRP